MQSSNTRGFMKLGRHRSQRSRNWKPHYNYYRDYDPAVGRYAQSDPLGVSRTTDTFGYTHGRPLTFVDLLGMFEILWKPGSFDESRHPPAWVVDVRNYGARLQRRIDGMCPKDRAMLQPFFDKWRVGYSPAYKNPSTDYASSTTTLTAPFFENSDPYPIFAHEFRHIMPQNNALYPGESTYIGETLAGRADNLDIERDANQFAKKIVDGCPCGGL